MILLPRIPPAITVHPATTFVVRLTLTLHFSSLIHSLLLDPLGRPFTAAPRLNAATFLAALFGVLLVTTNRN
jgi:hypothetical protein